MIIKMQFCFISLFSNKHHIKCTNLFLLFFVYLFLEQLQNFLKFKKRFIPIYIYNWQNFKSRSFWKLVDNKGLSVGIKLKNDEWNTEI